VKHRHYAAGDCKKFPGINYDHPQPFRDWKTSILTAAIGGWLLENPPRLELATLVLHELKLRGDDLNADMKFAASGLEPIGWLLDARDAVRAKFPETLIDNQMTGRRGAHVYVMLRGGYTDQNGWYGCYVGSTKKTPTARCLEHRKGLRSGRGLPRYGIEPLWSLFDFLNPVPTAKAARMEWETRLHEALAPVVPKVTGDVAF